MKDSKQPLRTAYYQLLNGNLSYNSTNVPVSDDLVKAVNSGVMVYVILSTQSGNDTSTLSSFDSKEKIIIEIVSKAQSRTSKQVVDTVAAQILNLLLPAPGMNALPAQSGFVIQNVQKTSDTYLDLAINQSTTVVRRLLTFTQTMRQTS